jgi:hypothetical protein
LDRVVVDLVLDSGWTSEVQELGEEAVDRCATNDGLSAGDQRAGGLSWYGQRRDSVQKPVVSAVHQKAEMRQSTPMMCRVTSATTNLHVKSQRKPKFRLRGIHP